MNMINFDGKLVNADYIATARMVCIGHAEITRSRFIVIELDTPIESDMSKDLTWHFDGYESAVKKEFDKIINAMRPDCFEFASRYVAMDSVVQVESGVHFSKLYLCNGNTLISNKFADVDKVYELFNTEGVGYA